ncbi:MAG: hypothetical protein QM783_02135 [Phycisphaerales bacterium]
MDLWAAIHECFDEDDGSLPDVVFNGLTPEQVSVLCRAVRAYGGVPTSRGGTPTFWHKARQVELPIDSVPDAAALVTSGEAEAFCFMLPDVRFQGVQIPDLSFFVWPDSLSIFYKMGKGWDARSLEAFFMLLRSLLILAPGARLDADDEFPCPKLFSDTWSYFLRFHPLPVQTTGGRP